MKELREIIQSWERCTAAGKKAALITVVHLEGSSYRRPGARMLVDEDGQITGSISGGCLEGDALRKALYVIQQGKSRLVTYDTSDEEDISFGIQLGCEGVIQVLFEPIHSPSSQHTFDLLRRAVADREPKVLVTLFHLSRKDDPHPGTCLLMDQNGIIAADNIFSSYEDSFLDGSKKVFESQRSIFWEFPYSDKTLNAFFEWVEPPVSLVVVGAGNDAIPLVRMADLLGWESRVVDGRSTHAKAERFTAACQILVSKPEKVLEQLSIDARTVFVLMTHNYNYDLSMLHALLKRKVTYIGVLGPRKKMDRMMGDLTKLGYSPRDEDIMSLFGPVGYDIGAETAEEIALSILAEIKAFLSNRPGGSLKHLDTFIHDRAHLSIQKVNLDNE